MAKVFVSEMNTKVEVVMTEVEAAQLRAVLEKASNRSISWTYDETILVNQLRQQFHLKGI